MKVLVIDKGKAGPEVRDVKKWPPEKDGKYWCVVEGIPSALGKWMLLLDYSKEEGGFLQEDDGFKPIWWLTNEEPFAPSGSSQEGDKELIDFSSDISLPLIQLEGDERSQDYKKGYVDGFNMAGSEEKSQDEIWNEIVAAVAAGELFEKVKPGDSDGINNWKTKKIAELKSKYKIYSNPGKQ